MHNEAGKVYACSEQHVSKDGRVGGHTIIDQVQKFVTFNVIKDLIERNLIIQVAQWPAIRLS